MPKPIEVNNMSHDDFLRLLSKNHVEVGDITLSYDIEAAQWVVYGPLEKDHHASGEGTYKIRSPQLAQLVYEGIIAIKEPVVPGNWSAVSLAVGSCGGFLWMATEGVITAEAPMIMTVFAGTFIVYASSEILLFRKNNDRWPNSQELRKIGLNTRDLGLKLMASVAGWMTGSYYAEKLGFGNALTTALVSFFDTVCVVIANTANELPKCKNGKDVKSLNWDNIRLLIPVAGAAAIWQQFGISKLPRMLAAAFNGLAITAEFYLAYKIPFWVSNAIKPCCYGNSVSSSHSKVSSYSPSFFTGLESPRQDLQETQPLLVQGSGNAFVEEDPDTKDTRITFTS